MSLLWGIPIAFLILVAVVLLILARKPGPQSLSVPPGAQAGELSAFEPCIHHPSRKKIAAQCASLTVPENWSDPHSRLITLPVVRFTATGQAPAEPVFILLGGPGASNLITYPKDWLLERHDVILVGYRGVDGSVDLACREITRVSAAYLGKDFLSEAANAELATAVKSCAAALQSAGVDLRGYTAEGVVEDLEAARRALGYPRINLWSESYGTRVAQLYAYLYPHSLERMVMIGMNPPGHFVYDPAVLDDLVRHLSDLCAQDAGCPAGSTSLAQAMDTVNHHMPRRWLFFRIDPGTLRLLTHMMFFNSSSVAMVSDAYVSAAGGDPAGLALLNFIAPFVFPFEMFHMGDFLNKGGSLDREYYQGPESIGLGDSILGAPLAEWIWPMAAEWPVELVDEDLRRLQESEVEMLVINGTVDFSTPPNALEEIKDYYHCAQIVLLPEFSHVGDVTGLQPQAFRQLITSYYDTGTADASLFQYQPVQFKFPVHLASLARLIVGVAAVLLSLLALGIGLIISRLLRG